MLPLSDPIQIFLVVLTIILVAPLFGKIRIPHIIVLIVAGMALGPYGLHVLDNGQSFELFGKVGLLYIMFLAGIEIDLNTFRRNSAKGAVFGIYTFFVPMILGIAANMWLLHLDWMSATLLAAIYASHTLIAYPAISKMGVSKSRAVSIAVAGTIVTVTAALLLLAVIVALRQGTADVWYWVRFATGTMIFGAVVFWLLPLVARFFLHKVSDNVTQYIFVLAVVFFASLLAEIVGLSGILGAFFAGLALNRLVPSVSPLMNRIEFVGNAIFIPFFLISIGMMMNIDAFTESFDSIYAALVMTAMVLGTKWLAAWLTQKSCRMRPSERRTLFGLSCGRAAVTLAVIMIGHQIGLLSESVLNGSVLMILLTCTVSTVVTEKAARQLATEELQAEITHQKQGNERILIPISAEQDIRHLIDVGNLLKPQHNHNALYAVYVDSEKNENVSGTKLMEAAANLAAATDNQLTTSVKSGVNVANCILETVAEHGITDLLMTMHKKSRFADTFLGNTISGLVKESALNIFVYKPMNALSDVKRLVVVVPDKAELEQGFEEWFSRIRNIATNLGAKTLFYASNRTKTALERLCHEQNFQNVRFTELASWEDFLFVTKSVRQRDSVIIISARKGTLSYNPLFERLPHYLTKYFSQNNVALLFPRQSQANEKTGELYNPMHV
jgi:Kef-type K+ transport system membrane component KefB